MSLHYHWCSVTGHSVWLSGKCRGVAGLRCVVGCACVRRVARRMSAAGGRGARVNTPHAHRRAATHTTYRDALLPVGIGITQYTQVLQQCLTNGLRYVLFTIWVISLINAKYGKFIHQRYVSDVCIGKQSCISFVNTRRDEHWACLHKCEIIG